MELVGHGSPAMLASPKSSDEGGTALYSHADDEQKAKSIAALPAVHFAAKGKRKRRRTR